MSHLQKINEQQFTLIDELNLDLEGQNIDDEHL